MLCVLAEKFSDKSRNTVTAVANKLAMVDENSDVRKTFNDYQEETSLQLMRMHIPEGHEWVDKTIREVNISTGSLALMIKRGKQTVVTRGIRRYLPIKELKLPKNELIAMVIRGEETIIPDGNTIIKENDIVVMYQERA